MGLLQDAVDGGGQVGPGLHLLLEGRPPLPGDVVIAAFAAGLLLLPLADDEAGLFEFVEAGVEGAFAPGEGAVGVAVDRGGDFVAVHRLAAEQGEDQERQGAFEEFGVHRKRGQGVRYIGVLGIIAAQVRVSSEMRKNFGRYSGYEAATSPWVSP